MEEIIAVLNEELNSNVYTVRELSERIGIPRACLYLYANGKVKTGRFVYVMALCDYFGIEPYKVYKDMRNDLA